MGLKNMTYRDPAGRIMYSIAAGKMVGYEEYHLQRSYWDNKEQYSCRKMFGSEKHHLQRSYWVIKVQYSCRKMFGV